MFRALLWKEWRELWMLPVAAGLVAVFARILLQPALRPEQSDVLTEYFLMWIGAFAVWQGAAAVYIPAHLFARDRGAGAMEFSSSKPLDLFRLWWFKLVIGLTVFAAAAVVLYTVNALFNSVYPYLPDNGFDQFWENIVWNITFISLMVYSLSSVISAFSGRRVSAVFGTLVVLLISFELRFFIVLSAYPMDTLEDIFVESPNYTGLLSLITIPVLLLSSLVFLSRGNVWRQTVKNRAAAYIFSGALVFLPTAIGFIHYSSDMKEFLRVDTQILLQDISQDGRQIFLRILPGDMFVVMDLENRKAEVIDSDALITLWAIGEQTVTMVPMRRTGLLYMLVSGIIKDPETEHYETSQFRTFLDPRPRGRSNNGKYWALTKSCDKYSGEDGFIVISDSEGNILGRHIFPILEEVHIYPIGWDHRSRFYFEKFYYNRSEPETVWRVQPDHVVPRRVEFIPAKETARYILSPDGRWMITCPQNTPSWDELWLSDLSMETSILLSTDLRSRPPRWSHGGNVLAYMEGRGEDYYGKNEETPALRLILHELATGDSRSISLEGLPEGLGAPSWSFSNENILLKRISFDEQYIVSVDTGQITEFPILDRRYRSLTWIAGDRLLWIIENKLLVTDLDGSNPEEVFRVEDGKMYLYGEEQG